MADENTESYVEFVKELDFSNKYAGLAASFASGVVAAYEKSEKSAASQVAILADQTQEAANKAIFYLDEALAAGDAATAEKWAVIAGDFTERYLDLSGSTQSAEARLLEFDGRLSKGYALLGEAAGNFFDAYSIFSAIENGDGDEAGTASLSLIIGMVAVPPLASATFPVLATVALGGAIAVVGSLAAGFLNENARYRGHGIGVRYRLESQADSPRKWHQTRCAT